MTKRQKQHRKEEEDQNRVFAAMCNEYPVRFLDMEGKQPVLYGDPRWNDAQFEEQIQIDGRTPRLSELR